MTLQVNLNSEVGRLRAVMLHRPGPELENMTPATIKEALYSDLLSTRPAQKEYRQLEAILSGVCTPFYIDDLLREVLEKVPESKNYIMGKLRGEGVPEETLRHLESLDAKTLGKSLVDGLPGTAMNPMYNLYFTRDIGVCFNHHAMPTHMATKVRSVEILITDTIYKYHPFFTASQAWVNPWENAPAGTRLEGGDFLVAAPDVFVIGQGARSNRNGVDVRNLLFSM